MSANPRMLARMANHQADERRAETHTAFATRIRERFPNIRDKQDAAKLADQLLANPLWPIVEEMIGERLESLSSTMDGEVQAAVQVYAHIHGTRQGLRWARDLPRTIKVICSEADADAEEG